MSADRSPFICQTQSLNLFFQNVNFAKLSSALMYGWKKGLKTGSYYIRTKSITEANKALGIVIVSSFFVFILLKFNFKIFFIISQNYTF